MPKPPRPTEAELEILAILWQRGSATVREVHEAVSAERGTGYTSTLKLMQLMVGKGLLQREDEQRPHVYRAVGRPDKMRGEIVGRLVDRVFGGSTSALVQQALGRGKVSAEEMDAIRALLDAHAKDRRG